MPTLCFCGGLNDLWTLEELEDSVFLLIAFINWNSVFLEMLL